jgi:hypothetical protein
MQSLLKDVLRNVHSVRGLLSGSFSASGLATMSMGSVHGGIVISGNRATVPISGLYRMMASVTFTPVTGVQGSYIQIGFMKNGVNISPASGTVNVSGPTYYATAVQHDLAYLNAGDNISVQVSNATTGAISINAGLFDMEYVGT